jgi:hypothetical protein
VGEGVGGAYAVHGLMGRGLISTIVPGGVSGVRLRGG